MTDILPFPSSKHDAAASVGIVVIGRNEGERLIASLQSLRDIGCPVVYVDSGSADGSPARARPLCDAVIELAPARPFSAARARNEGGELLVRRHPEVRHVQFLDGDCILLPGWIQQAAGALDADPRCGIVIGQLQERDPDASAYNRLCSLEWKSPAGVIVNYGSIVGIMMVRAQVFTQLGGFNTRLIAGEDPEFAVRAGLAGHTVRKLDVPMAVHDADIHRFAQWWTRSVRAGHAIGQRAHVNGKTAARDCIRELRSTAVWSLFLPLLILATVVPTRGWSLLLLLSYPMLGYRIYRWRIAGGDNASDARLYTGFTLIGKFANGLGLLKFVSNQMLGRFRLIEYK
jgi:GT2 family glycosyltransferase